MRRQILQIGGANGCKVGLSVQGRVLVDFFFVKQERNDARDRQGSCGTVTEPLHPQRAALPVRFEVGSDG